jgi:hypothetical protein
MSKRKYKRFAITLNANIVIGEKTYKGVIGNISEEGILTSLTTFIKTDDTFMPQKNVSLSFDLPTGETVDMNSEVRWFIKPLEKGKALMLGLYIIDPPSEYTEWLKKFK